MPGWGPLGSMWTLDVAVWTTTITARPITSMESWAIWAEQYVPGGRWPLGNDAFTAPHQGDFI